MASGRAPVAILFDYDADFSWTTQPHGRGLDYFWLVFDTYRALRSMGLSIDILPPDSIDFRDYRMVLAPGLVHMPDSLKSALANSGSTVVIGPRAACRDASMRIPVPLPPDLPGMDVTVASVESLRPDMPVPLAGGGAATGWLERLEGGATVLETTHTGAPVLVAEGKLHYLGAWLDQPALRRVLGELCRASGLETLDLPDGVRRRDTGTERFWFNYDNEDHLVGGLAIPAVGFVREELPR